MSPHSSRPVIARALAVLLTVLLAVTGVSLPAFADDVVDTPAAAETVATPAPVPSIDPEPVDPGPTNPEPVDLEPTAEPAATPAPALTATSSPCLLYTSPSPRDGLLSRMPSSA